MAEFMNFNEIGGTQLLNALRQSESTKEKLLRRNQLSGVNFASAALGSSLGGALKAGLRRTGMMPDREMERAKAFDKAVEAGTAAVEGQEFENPFARHVAQDEATATRLRAAGLAEEADKFQQRADARRVQALEFRKLNADVKDAEAEPLTEADRLLNTLERATAAREAGRTREANALEALAAKQAGISPQKGHKPPEILTLVREMGLDPKTGRGRELIEGSIVGSQQSDQRDRKIADLVARGIDRAKAQDIVDGNIKMEVVPQTGQVRLTNVVTGEASEVPLGAAGGIRDAIDDGPALGPAPQPTPERSLYEMAEFATGPQSAVANWAAAPMAWVGLEPPERVVQARQAMATETQNLIRALAVNPRFPVAEMERIRQEVNIQPKIWDDPELLRTRMREVDFRLRQRAEQAAADAANPNLPQDLRSAQAQNAQNIANFLEVLGAPEPKAAPPQENSGEQRRIRYDAQGNRIQ